MAFSLTPHLCEVTIRALSHLIAVEGGATDEQPEGGSAAWLTATIGPGTMVRQVSGGPGPCLNFLSAEPELVLVNAQRFTKTANCWGVANNTAGTNSNRIVLLRRREDAS